MNPNRRIKLQQLYNILDGKTQATVTAYNDYKKSLLDAEQKLKQAINAETLDEVNKKLKQIEKNIDFKPLLASLENLQQIFEDSHQDIKNEFLKKIEELKNTSFKDETEYKSLVQEITDLQNGLLGKTIEITGLNKSILGLTEEVKNYATKKSVVDLRKDFETFKQEEQAEDSQTLLDLEKKFTKLKTDVLSLTNRGGALSRDIFIGGNNPLKKWKDINFKAGSNVTLSFADNNSTHQVDVTIAASGTGGYTVETPTGTIDGSNVTFTVTATPVYIVSDGTTYFQNNGYTLSDLTVTMSVPPTGYIRSFHS